MPCHKKHKLFVSYLRFSIQEGLLTESTSENIQFGRYNKDLYSECEWCYQVFDIEKAFKENAFLCNGCYRLLDGRDIREVISPKIFICYSQNQMYRICSNIDRCFAESIFQDENKKDKEGCILKETIYKYRNSKRS